MKSKIKLVRVHAMFADLALSLFYAHMLHFSHDNILGGVWNTVNDTSALQLNSILYRFHPAVLWSKFFPQRAEIVGGTYNIPHTRSVLN
jgi:hypothetical protein